MSRDDMRKMGTGVSHLDLTVKLKFRTHDLHGRKAVKRF